MLKSGMPGTDRYSPGVPLISNLQKCMHIHILKERVLKFLFEELIAFAL